MSSNKDVEEKLVSLTDVFQIRKEYHDKSISHVLFEHLASVQNRTTLDLYKSFLSQCIGTECSTGLSGIINEHVLTQFFNYERAPAYFNCKTYYDLTLLSNLIDRPLVILYCKSIETYKRNLGIKKFFDNRVLHSNLTRNSETYEQSVSYLVTEKDELYFLPQNFHYNVIQTEHNFVQEGFKLNGCLLEGIEQLLSLPKHDCLARPQKCQCDLLSLCWNQDLIYSKRLNLEHAVCIVSHIRTDVYNKKNSQQLFVTLGVLKSATTAGNGVVDWNKTRYVSITADKKWLYLLKDRHVQNLLPDLDKSLKEHKTKRKEEKCDIIKARKKPVPFTNNNNNNDTTTTCCCPCQFCQRSKAYGSKQLQRGPQTLNKQKLSIFDLLVHFNLNSDKNRAAVLRCCDLSVASLDFECLSETSVENPLARVPRDLVSHAKLGSGNVPLIVQKPVLFAHADFLSSSSSSSPYYHKFYHVVHPDDFGNVLRDYINDLLERQKLLREEKLKLLTDLFKFVDVFKNNHKQFFFKKGVKPKTTELSWNANLFGKFEKELYRLCHTLRVYSFNGARYDHVILARHIVMACNDISVRPEPLIPPFYSQKEESYFEKRKMTTKAKSRGDLVAAAAASQTPPRKAAKRDLPFDDDGTLSSSSSNENDADDEKEEEEVEEDKNLRETSPRPIRVRLSKEGSIVNHICLVKHHLAFYDLKKFLPPNASLGSLADMMGCKESKGMFPFEQLTSYDWLLNQKELPADREAWRSRLNDKAPSQEAIDECIAGYRSDGHPNVLSYLMKYLRLDVELLLECTVKLFLSFYDMVGSHPVTSGKNSISSFSFASLQTNLMNQKSVGAFVPNHPKLFSIIKGSLLGGVSLVCRTDGGSYSKIPINQHLGHANMPKKVLYYDINSLYGISGKLLLQNCYYHKIKKHTKKYKNRRSDKLFTYYLYFYVVACTCMCFYCLYAPNRS